MDALGTVNTRHTPQNRPADPRQVGNHAGGYTFTLTPRARLRRFLTLGVDGGTFYIHAPDLAWDNARVVFDFAEHDHATLRREIREISMSGRAPRANPALFALAIAASHGNATDRAAALDALPHVARTGTHLFLFARYVERFRGWGRALRRGVARWYSDKAVDTLAYQMVKYRQREGWTHKDLLRLSHMAGYHAGDHAGGEEQRRNLYTWAVGKDHQGVVPAVLHGFLCAQAAPADRLPHLIRTYRLTWEMLPTEALTRPDVWKALLSNGLPMTALIRQLPRLTSLGLLDDPEHLNTVVAQLTDPDHLRKARIHPINLLIAQRTYASGRAVRGSTTWDPHHRIVDALDAAFYASFANVAPTGGRTLLALDVSGSMTVPSIAGMPLTPREASAAMALITAATETDYDIVGFTGGYRPWSPQPPDLTRLTISPRQRLDDVIHRVSNLPFGPTDCSLPMLWASQEQKRYDTFVIYTDNETWSGRTHPHQALREYREKVNPHAKLVVVGMTATGFTIADPADSGMLDVAGFDSSVPTVISDFARGL